ncbi:MAG: hypothetical protein RR842_04030 [Gordonibacter sp.]|uniref:hypothetical protein n=1 Tax=Gordonibacter sp. TaxID=1968902 RepID=UPI002FC83C44
MAEEQAATENTEEEVAEAAEELEAKKDSTTDAGTDQAGITVNKNKYERDIAKRDKEIENLKSQIGEASKTEEGRKNLEVKIADLEKQVANTQVEADLKVAGCRNIKAAKALLEDYDGDVTKLKTAEPYLFTSKETKSTGGSQKGNPDPEDSRTRSLRKSMGLDKDKEQ